MNDKERSQLIDFLNQDRQLYSDLLFLLFDTLSQQIDFKFKIQKASIQLIHKHPFAVIGFRKSKDYLFVEFYYNTVINNSRIVKTNILADSMIIHTVNLSSNAAVDDTIVNWIKSSYELTVKSDKRVV